MTSAAHPNPGMHRMTIVGLAMLGVPRVVAHDLGIAGPGVNAVLVFAPPAIWLAVLLAKRTPRPFRTALRIGLAYGIFVAVGHQVMWDAAFGPNAPVMGGSLADVMPTWVESVIMRGFAVISSVATGAVVGAIVGVLAWLPTQVCRRIHAREKGDDNLRAHHGPS
ncbi:hypothetical protein [Rhodococcus sp. HNM0563]|uniref:hypothetical protein n=1 Tax=Rhodococcus sp. HNM0563 TaxID=2716339 RepID=UPI00197D7B36|nr:hypothetical protein [Rhodococcus sp. HNM0563]